MIIHIAICRFDKQNKNRIHFRHSVIELELTIEKSSEFTYFLFIPFIVRKFADPFCFYQTGSLKYGQILGNR